MRLTVLGKSPSWQDAGGACSGYLVEHEGRLLLLDCGNGVFGKLRAVADYRAIEAVVLSHLHADHFLDLVPFAYALGYSPRRPAEAVPPVLHAPPGAGDIFRRVVGAWGGEDLIERSFDLREHDGSEPIEAAGVRLRFAETTHFVQTFAVSLEAGGGRFVFGADTGPSAALSDLAAGADVLMVEATLAEPDDGHLTARQAGEHARRAGVGRLVLTHRTDELDPREACEEAGQAFDGPVEVAREGAVYEL